MSTAVAIRQEGFSTLQFVSHLEQYGRLATGMVRSGMIPQKTPEAALTVILKGAELGLPPMQACASIHFIDGKLTLSADLMVAIAIQRCGVRMKVVENTAKRCEIQFSRPGWDAYTSVYTWEDAQAAKLVGKMNWQKHPREMLAARAKSQGVRMIAPDALAGVYSPDEMGAEIDEEGEILVGTVTDPSPASPAPEDVILPFGNNKGKRLGDLDTETLGRAHHWIASKAADRFADLSIAIEQVLLARDADQTVDAEIIDEETGEVVEPEG